MAQADGRAGEWLEGWQPLAALFLLATVARLLPLALPFGFDASDTPGYWEPAVGLATGQGYVDASGAATAERPPGYPLFLAAIITLVGPSLLAAQAAQALLGGAAAVAAVGIAAPLTADRRVALGAGLLAALDPVAIGQSPWLLREALLQAALTLLLLALVRLRGRARFATAALLLATLTLTHQLYLLLVGFLAVSEGAAAWRRRPQLRPLLRRQGIPWGALALVCVTALALWARRNERVLGRFSVVATENAVPARELWLTSACPNLWLSGDTATGFQERAFAEERRLVAQVGVEETRRLFYARAWRNWREHPARSLGRLARQNAWYWLEIPGAIRLAYHPRLYPLRWATLPFHWVRLACALAGVLWLVRSDRWRGAAPLLATLAFFALAPALLYPIPRYLAPAAPLLDVLAALGLAASLRARRGPR